MPHPVHPGSWTIALRGLRARGHHGLYEIERIEGQDFVVDAVLELDLTPAARSDDIADTVAFLASAEAKRITGVALPVDGGQTAG